MTDSSTSAAEHLLTQAGSIRALARGLLGDADGATEAAHEAWIAGQGAADSERFVRSSLRNRLKSWRRSSRRRDERERVASQSDSVPATDEIAAAAEIRHRVLEAVTGLAEPLRTTIWLRFFEDLPPRTIGKRMAVPVNTVRSRVRLGLDALRRRLDALHDGDRRRWQRALLPAAGYAFGAVLVVPVLGLLTMKKITLVLAATAVAFLGGNLALDLARSDAPIVPAATSAAAQASGPIASPEADPDSAREDVTSPPPELQGLRVQGTIALRSSLGDQLLQAGDGELHFTGSNGPDVRAVAIRNGGFELTMLGPETLDVARLVLDGWSIERYSIDWQYSPEQGTAVLRARAFPAGRLLVLDGATNAHLNAIDVVQVEPVTLDGLPNDRVWFPGLRGRAWLQDESSPIDLRGDSRESEYLVSAPGYAWRHTAIAHEYGGERLVFLAPGGDVEIEVRGLPAVAQPFLRIRNATGECVREGRLTAASVTLTRLPTGRHEVTVEHGERDAEPSRRLVIGEGSVEITRGGTAQLVIACDPMPELDRERRELTGTLTASASWGTTFAQVLAIPLDRPPVAGEVKVTASERRSWPLGRAQPWTCSGLLPGRYRLFVAGFGIERDVEVPASGPVTVDLVVPDPIEAEMLVVDRGTRAARSSTSVWLKRRGPDGVERFFVRGRFIDGQRWLLRCIPGNYILAAHAPWRVEREVTVTAGSSHQLEVAPTFGTLLEFRSGSARIPVDPQNVRLQPRVPGGRAVHVVDVGFQLTTHVNKPGKYVLQVDEPGYRPLRQEIEFNRDWHTTVIPLVRQ